MTSRPDRRFPIGAAAPILATLVLVLPAGRAWAQPAPSAAEAATVLGQVMPALRPTLAAVLDHGEALQPLPWRDAASGLSGTVAAGPPMRAGEPCRPIRVTVQGGARPLALDGQRCRGADGVWEPDRIADSVTLAPEASPLVRDLQVALHRLEYYPGAIDGIASDGFTRALLLFERDEGVPPTPRPDPALLDRADAAIGRIPGSGECPLPRPSSNRTALACGSIR